MSLNLGLFGFFKIGGAVPSLLLLLVILFSLEKDTHDFFFVSTVSGLFLDIFSGVFLGSFTLAFLILSLSINQLIHNVVVVEVNWKYLTGLVIVGVVFTNLFVWTYNLLAFKLGWGQYPISFISLRNLFLPELAYNLLLLYPVMKLSSLVKYINSRYLSYNS
jgi:hypothetical protein